LSHYRDGIAPHGVQLINRIATTEQRQEFLGLADSLPRVQLDERAVSDLEMIAIGAFSPLTGFMEQEDYNRVVSEMRLANGLPWSIPITLSVEEEIADSLKEGNWVRLDDTTGRFVGVLQLSQKYRSDKTREVINVYRTDEAKHPGVQVVYNQGPINLAGSVWMLQRNPIPSFLHTKLTQLSHGIYLRKRVGKRLLAFKPVIQSIERTSIFRSAMETVDGLFLHPLVGATKEDDIPPMCGCAAMRLFWKTTMPKTG
jgi:sulfate adenylyltransferase